MFETLHFNFNFNYYKCGLNFIYFALAIPYFFLELILTIEGKIKNKVKTLIHT